MRAGIELIPDRHYSDLSDDDLVEAHEKLYNSVIAYYPPHIADVATPELNELLEMARELTFREE